MKQNSQSYLFSAFEESLALMESLPEIGLGDNGQRETELIHDIHATSFHLSAEHHPLSEVQPRPRRSSASPQGGP